MQSAHFYFMSRVNTSDLDGNIAVEEQNYS